ncbi:MAG: MFS transporter [Candidatus Eremiobacteraeota bacterium]|nr:MFS transporter [Candidatus Eremiobacteraeota bacterium]
MTRSSVLGLAVFACVSFAYLTSEMLPIGLLPRIARSFDVSLPTAGMLLSAYALVVTLGGPPLTAMLGNVPRKRLLLVLVAALAFTATMSALAQTYAFLLAARLLNALAHGVFWAIVSSSAASLVAPSQRAIAIAIVYSGSSLGIIAGVPFATFVGERYGWHAGFWCVAGVAALAFGALSATDDIPAGRATSFADIRTLLADVSFLRLLLSTALVVIGHFTAFSYFAPLLARDDAASVGGVPVLLLVFGIAGFGSNFVFGALANRRGVVAIVTASAVMIAALLLLALDRGAFGPIALVALVAVWGAGTGGVVVALQTRVLAAQPDRPDVASALNSSAFNFGIGGGALVGGIVIGLGWLESLPVAAAILIAPAIALQVVPAPSRPARRRS